MKEYKAEHFLFFMPTQNMIKYVVKVKRGFSVYFENMFYTHLK